jgi:hypothetical protein
MNAVAVAFSIKAMLVARIPGPPPTPDIEISTTIHEGGHR